MFKFSFNYSLISPIFVLIYFKIRRIFACKLNKSRNVWFYRGQAVKNCPFTALNYNTHIVAAGNTHHLPDIANNARIVHIVNIRLVHRCILLAYKKNSLVIIHCFLKSFYAFPSANVKVKHHFWKYYNTPKRNNR